MPEEQLQNSLVKEHDEHESEQSEEEENENELTNIEEGGRRRKNPLAWMLTWCACVQVYWMSIPKTPR